MDEVLKLIINSLVENKDDVEISKTEENKEIKFIVKLNKEDMGKIIGKQGRMVKSIRNIIRSLAIKDKKHVEIEFIEK